MGVKGCGGGTGSFLTGQLANNGALGQCGRYWPHWPDWQGDFLSGLYWPDSGAIASAESPAFWNQPTLAWRAEWPQPPFLLSLGNGAICDFFFWEFVSRGDAEDAEVKA